MRWRFSASALLAGAACAQSDPVPSAPPAQALPHVEVTGSNIKQAETEGASPVQVITRDEIRRSGAATLRELFDIVSTVGGAQRDTGGRGTFSAGSSAASLRDLGSKSTLVLLNSRRVAPYPLAEYSEIFVNIDALPMEAIERVDILRSGASAIYGSEAVAGVINIITRTDYQGVYARASHQRSLFCHSFDSSTASLTGGFGNLASDRYNVLVNLETYHRDEVVWSDVIQYVNPALTAPFPSFGSYSTYSYPGNVVPAGPIAGCAAELVIGGLCRYNRYQRFEATPAANRLSFMTTGKLQLEPDLLGFAEVLYSQTRTSYLSPFQAYGPQLGTIDWGNPSTGEGRTFTYRGLPANHPLNPTGQNDADFRYRFIDGPNESSGEANQYRVLAGLRGTWDKFDWESAAGVMGGSADLKLRGQFSESGFRQAIGNFDPGQVDPQFFSRDYRIGQPNSAATIDTLFPNYGYKGSTRQVFVDGKLSGEALRFEGRPVNVALGVDLRHDRFVMTPTQNLRVGDIVGEGFLDSSAARIQAAVFGEVNWPATPQLEVQAAGRIDKFQGFGAHLSPKLGVRFEASPMLLLRGVIEAGFRAPNLSESSASKRFSFDGGIFDPKRCPQAQAKAADLKAAAALLPANDPQRTVLIAEADNIVNAECRGGVATVVENNPNLQPETSRSANLGLVFKPERDTSLALDYWTILRKNEIGRKGTSALLDAENGLPPGSIVRGDASQDSSFSTADRLKYNVTEGSLSQIIGRFENQTRTATSGIDLTVNSRFATPAGPLDLQVNGTYMLSFRNWSAVRGSYGDNLVGRGVYRLRSDVAASLTSGFWVNALTWHYASPRALQGDYDDTAWTPANCQKNNGWTEDQCREASRQSFDYYLAYRPIRELTLSANVRNVFNRRPPVNLRGLATGGGGFIPQDVSDVMGRMLRLTVEYRFR